MEQLAKWVALNDVLEQAQKEQRAATDRISSTKREIDELLCRERWGVGSNVPIRHVLLDEALYQIKYTERPAQRGTEPIRSVEITKLKVEVVKGYNLVVGQGR